MDDVRGVQIASDVEGTRQEWTRILNDHHAGVGVEFHSGAGFTDLFICNSLRFILDSSFVMAQLHYQTTCMYTSRYSMYALYL